ncbi:MAG: hypothetical protein GY854_20415 [Deltaproteobacteria bacterium]|nr:hypothetical protein [Deltaproteobacteria bacterium]
MSSQGVVARQKSSASVQVAIKNHTGAMARGMGDLLGEETGPAAAVLLDRALEQLETDTHAMLQAESDHLKDIEIEVNDLAFHDALRQYDRTFSVVARLASTLLEVVGETDIARKVGPSEQRPGLTAAHATSPGADSAA